MPQNFFLFRGIISFAASFMQYDSVLLYSLPFLVMPPPPLTPFSFHYRYIASSDTTGDTVTCIPCTYVSYKWFVICTECHQHCQRFENQGQNKDTEYSTVMSRNCLMYILTSK